MIFPVVAAYTPIVLWHGMGDSALGLKRVEDGIKQALPGVFVHSIQLGNSDIEDRKATVFGNLHQQVEQVCKELSGIPALKDGFNAIGFSQGGQSFRAYVQKCDHGPKVKVLATFGAQHMGISELPHCEFSSGRWSDGWLCKLMTTAVQVGVYDPYVQEHIVQAQYFRDPQRIRDYLRYNRFLTDINNEIHFNSTYKQRIMQLEKLILVTFEQDAVVVPKESGWFESYDKAGKLIPFKKQQIFVEDAIGLKSLYKDGKIIRKSVKGGHMHLPLETFIQDFIIPYFGDEVQFRTQ